MLNQDEFISEPKDLLLFTIQQHSLKLDKIITLIDDIDDRLIRIEERIGFKDKMVEGFINVVSKPMFWWIILLIGASLNFEYLKKILEHFMPIK